METVEEKRARMLAEIEQAKIARAERKAQEALEDKEFKELMKEV